MKRRIMRRFRIDEISGVDSPAQKYADVRIFKNYQGEKPMETNYAKQVEEVGQLAEGVLEIKTQELLRLQPELSHAQAYSKVYCARENLGLGKSRAESGAPNASREFRSPGLSQSL